MTYISNSVYIVWKVGRGLDSVRSTPEILESSTEGLNRFCCLILRMRALVALSISKSLFVVNMTSRPQVWLSALRPSERCFLSSCVNVPFLQHQVPFNCTQITKCVFCYLCLYFRTCKCWKKSRQTKRPPTVVAQSIHVYIFSRTT